MHLPLFSWYPRKRTGLQKKWLHADFSVGTLTRSKQRMGLAQSCWVDEGFWRIASSRHGKCVLGHTGCCKVVSVYASHFPCQGCHESQMLFIANKVTKTCFIFFSYIKCNHNVNDHIKWSPSFCRERWCFHDMKGERWQTNLPNFQEYEYTEPGTGAAESK